MGLANILISKISQIQKNKYGTIPVIPGKFVDTGNKIKVTTGGGSYCSVHAAFIGDHGKVQISGVGAQHRKCI